MEIQKDNNKEKASQQETQNPLEDEIHKMNSEIEDINLGKEENKTLSKADKILKIMTLIRLYSTLKLLKEDNKPVEIIKNLFIGSVGASMNKEALLQNKITHIVIAATNLKPQFPNTFKYIQFNLLDSETENIKQTFITSGEFIDNAIKEGGSVMVHCHAGVSRSSTILLAYLLKYKGMTVDEALTLAKEKRQKINPNAGFIRQLREYEEELKEKKQ